MGCAAVAVVASALSASGQAINFIEPRLYVHQPAAIVGQKFIIDLSNQGEGTANDWGREVDSNWVQLEVVKPTDTLAGTVPTQNLTGKIALVYRGTFNFSEKAYNVQQAGASVCIIVNNVPGTAAFNMAAGTNATLVNIPVVMITKEEGDAIAARLNASQTVTASLTNYGFGLANDLGIINNSASAPHAFALPRAQMAAGTSAPAYRNYPAAVIANLGTTNQANTRLRATVNFTPNGGTASQVRVDSVVYGSFNTIDSVDVVASTVGYNLPAPTQTGRYDIRYQVVSSATQQNLADDTSTITIHATDSIFSKGRYDFTTNTVRNQFGTRLNSGGVLTWGPLYYVAAPRYYARKVQFYAFLNRNAGTTDSIYDTEVVTAALYRWRDANTDFVVQSSELTLVGDGSKTMTEADKALTNFEITLNDINAPNTPPVMTDTGWYWVALQMPGSMFFAVDENVNWYSRRFAEERSTPRYPEVWAPQLSGTVDPTSTSQAMSSIPFIAATNVPAYNTTDSIGYFNFDNVPSVALHSSAQQAPNSVAKVPSNFLAVTLAPNPASREITLTYNVMANKGNTQYRIIDALGRFVTHKNLGSAASGRETISISELAPGTYHLMLITGDQVSTQPFTVLSR